MLVARLRSLTTSLLGTSTRPSIASNTATLVPRTFAFGLPNAVRQLATLLPPPLQWRNAPPPPGTMPRAEKITIDHIGQTFLVHSGKDFKRVKVTMQMVDHKFGEFVLTRKRRPPPVKKQQRTKKK